MIAATNHDKAVRHQGYKTPPAGLNGRLAVGHQVNVTTLNSQGQFIRVVLHHVNQNFGMPLHECRQSLGEKCR